MQAYRSRLGGEISSYSRRLTFRRATAKFCSRELRIHSFPSLSTGDKFVLAAQDSFDYSSFALTGILAAQNCGRISRNGLVVSLVCCPCLGEERINVHIHSPLGQPLYGGHSLGRRCGPGFRKRVFDFWDGERTFRVRLLAPMAGEWKWQSGSSPTDPGLSGLYGEFRAIDWSEKENDRIRFDEVFFGPVPITTRLSKRMALRFLSSVIPGMRRPPIVFVGTMMTNSVRSDRMRDSRTIFATARLKVTTPS